MIARGAARKVSIGSQAQTTDLLFSTEQKIRCDKRAALNAC